MDSTYNIYHYEYLHYYLQNLDVDLLYVIVILITIVLQNYI